MSDRVILIEHERKFYVQYETTLYSVPTAVRQWWEVSAISYSPYAVGEERMPPVGEKLSPTHTHERGRAQYVTSKTSIFFPDGGKTQACRRWEASIPPPRTARVVAEKWKAERGDVTYLWGGWIKQMAKSEKTLPVAWDKLNWDEKILLVAVCQ